MLPSEMFGLGTIYHRQTGTMTTNQLPNPQTSSASNAGKCISTLPASYYCSDQIFTTEQQQIFQSTWQYVGHVSMLAEPGDYLTASVVGAEVLVVHGCDGLLRAFHNVCRHRGHILKEGAGRCTHLVCPYHAWSYHLDGSLERAAHVEDLVGFDRERAALNPLRMEIFHGLLLVNSDNNAIPLVEQVPDLDQEMAQYAPRLAQLKYVKSAEFDLKANWKVAIDNFLECYHCAVVHRSLVVSRDLDHYRIVVSSIWASHHSDESPGGQTPWDMSQATDHHAVSWWLWPNLCLVKHPGDDRVVVLSLRIEGTQQTVQVVDFFLASQEPTVSDSEYISFYLENVRPEDKAVIEGVQRGMRSGGFTPGQLANGSVEDGRWTEHAVAHFQSLVRDALQVEKGNVG